MISTIVSNSMEIGSGNGACGRKHGWPNPLKCESRRNSIPPAQTPSARHMLAYLPRPSTDSSRYETFTPKQPENTTIPSEVPAEVSQHRRDSVTSKKSSTFANLLQLSRDTHISTDRALHRRLSGSEPVGFQSALPGKHRMSVSINTEDLPTRYHRPSRSEQASTKWHPGPVAGIPNSFRSKTPTRSINSVQTFGSEKTPNQRCKLIGDDRQLLNSTNKQRQRYVTKDGKCRVNLGKIEDRSRFLSDIFTTMVDLKYRWFLFIFMMCYVVTWVLFAGIYFLDAWLRDDVNHTSDPKWRPCVENIDSFLSALLFSIESQRTIGYGYRMVTSNCSEGVILIMAQSIIGSMIDALMVGCMFVKISRPKKRAQTLIFSKSCVISHRDEELCLMFRIGDLRDSHMVDAKVRAKLIKSRQTKEGEFIPLEQSELNLGYDTGEDRLFLVEPQIICHTINESSPFWDMSADGLKREQFEIIVILEGIVEATGMTCQARTSYKDDEIVWGHRFEPCMSLEKGAFRVDYSRFEKTFDVQTPPSSAKEMQALKDMERNEMSALSLYWDHMGHTCTSTDLEHRLSRAGIGDITEEKSTEMIDSDFEV
ncbi:G protein-activated inward rectifier potassium channel 4 [Acipenser ruthenus]|uniref:G protein-activated inward rectifier potassium channel 3 n=1 Tax=Acipenser ruthenus TaxID=7906 RepID=A0A444USY2_ACIRT|nr:G protein-activated inward rectifier potassium channel 4 [Acipenser ruthenus]